MTRKTQFIFEGQGYYLDHCKPIISTPCMINTHYRVIGRAVILWIE